MAGKKKITIKDIARLAGVHPSSVSRVINGNKGVGKETERRIKELIELVGYYPDARAQSLSKRRAGAIAVVTPRANKYFFSMPFYPILTHGVADVVQGAEIALILETAEKDSYVKLFRRNMVDGVIIVGPTFNDPRIIELLNSGYPFVLAGKYSPHVQVSSVMMDNVGGAKIATEHLIKLGYRDIGYIGGPLSYYPGQERFEGFRQAMLENGVPINEEWVIELESSDPLVARKAVYGLLKQKRRPRALFVYGDMAALSVIRSAKDLGLRVPEDLAVVGFDDIPFARFMDPPLTTVRQPIYEMGREAATILLELISSNKQKTTKKILPTKLIIRKSCGAKDLNKVSEPFIEDIDWAT